MSLSLVSFSTESPVKLTLEPLTLCTKQIAIKWNWKRVSHNWVVFDRLNPLQHYHCHPLLPLQSLLLFLLLDTLDILATRCCYHSHWQPITHSLSSIIVCLPSDNELFDCASKHVSNQFHRTRNVMLLQQIYTPMIISCLDCRLVWVAIQWTILLQFWT